MTEAVIRPQGSQAKFQSGRLGNALLRTGKEVQTGFGLDWPLLNSFIHGLDNRYTEGPGLSDSDDTLPGHKEDTCPHGSGVLVDIKGIFNQAIGYSTGGQHNA